MLKIFSTQLAHCQVLTHGMADVIKDKFYLALKKFDDLPSNDIKILVGLVYAKVRKDGTHLITTIRGTGFSVFF